MSRMEAEIWLNALEPAGWGLWTSGDYEGKAFFDEWAFLLCEFIFDCPIQRKPY